MPYRSRAPTDEEKTVSPEVCRQKNAQEACRTFHKKRQKRASTKETRHSLHV